MGALSKMTGDPIYESVALRALRKLWSMQSSLKLFGTTLDVATGQWIEYSSGIGAGRLTLTHQGYSHWFGSLDSAAYNLHVSFVGFYFPGLF